jgi:hypothetical protein
MLLCGYSGLPRFGANCLLADDLSERDCGLPNSDEGGAYDPQSRTGLDRDKMRFWTAVIILISKVPDFIELVIKVVSYGSCHSKLRIQLSEEG